MQSYMIVNDITMKFLVVTPPSIYQVISESSGWVQTGYDLESTHHRDSREYSRTEELEVPRIPEIPD